MISILLFVYVVCCLLCSVSLRISLRISLSLCPSKSTYQPCALFASHPTLAHSPTQITLNHIHMFLCIVVSADFPVALWHVLDFSGLLVFATNQSLSLAAERSTSQSSDPKGVQVELVYGVHFIRFRSLGFRRKGQGGKERQRQGEDAHRRDQPQVAHHQSSSATAQLAK